MTMMMMSLSRSGIESTQQKRRDVEKPSRVIWRIKKATTTSKEEEERIITRDDFDARVFTKICIMSLVLCACVLERERDERKCPAFCVIPVVTKTGDFLSKFFFRRRRRMMMMMTTMMAICPSSSSMTTTTTTRSFSRALQKCWRQRSKSGARRRRCLLVVSASKGRGERERDAGFGERDVLKRLGKLKRAVAQNRTKDTVPTAETIGMRFSEVLLQSCSSSIYVVVVAREFVFFTFFQFAFLLEERHPFVPYRSSIADRAVFLSFILCSMMMMMHKKCCFRQKTTRVFATTSSTTSLTCRRRGTCRTRRRLLSRRIKSRKNVGWCTKR